MKTLITASGNPAVFDAVDRALQQRYRHLCAQTANDLMNMLAQTAADVVFMDAALEQSSDLHTLSQVLSIYPDRVIIYIGTSSSDATIAQARQVGVYAAIYQPLEPGVVQFVVEKALEKAELTRTISYLQAQNIQPASVQSVPVPSEQGTLAQISGAHEFIRRFSQALTATDDPAHLSSLLLDAAVMAVRPTTLALIQRTPQGAYQVSAAEGLNVQLLEGVVFSAEHGIVRWLLHNRMILARRDISTHFDVRSGVAVTAVFDHLHAQLMLPMIAVGNLTGILCAGLPMTGIPYSREDIELLATIAGYGARALYTAQAQPAPAARQQTVPQQVRTEIKEVPVEVPVPDTALTDAVACALIEVNTDGIITLINPYAASLLQSSVDELTRRDLARVSPELGEVCARVLEQDETVELAEITESSSGKDLLVSTAAKRNREKNLTGVVLLGIPVMKLQPAEIPARNMPDHEDFWEQVAGRMAHEIKNPLVAIKTFTQLLPERYTDDDFRENFSEIVNKAIDKINGITEHLVEYSKKSILQLQPVALEGVVEQAVTQIQQDLAEKDIALKQAIANDLGAVNIDPDQVRIALYNLLKNAAYFTAAGGTIELKAQRVTAQQALETPRRGAVIDALNHQLPDKNGYVEIIISDTGRGIDPADMSRIFMPFYSSKIQGMGLGLATVRSIVQEHKGRIDIESVQEQGTLCRMFLPLGAQPESRAAAEKTETIKSQTG